LSSSCATGVLQPRSFKKEEYCPQLGNSCDKRCDAETSGSKNVNGTPWLSHWFSQVLVFPAELKDRTTFLHAIHCHVTIKINAGLEEAASTAGDLLFPGHYWKNCIRCQAVNLEQSKWACKA
jgi:hypothetical protein